jgi:hypothetical protein
MKTKHLILAAALLTLTMAAQAQEVHSTARIMKQHHLSQFQKRHLNQTIASILDAINGDNVGLQQSAVQSLRTLEQLLPDEPFTSLIAPLTEKLKNSSTDRTVRLLAALALDELHSDAGDAAINATAAKSDDEGLQLLCKALIIGADLK